MKSILLMSLLMILPQVSHANSLLGPWRNCERGTKGDIEYIVEFGKDGMEYEIFMMKGQSILPCKGKDILVISRYWKYETGESAFNSTLLKTLVTLEDKDLVQRFNKKVNCGVSNWIPGRPIDCTNISFWGFYESKGFSIKHTFQVSEEKLIVKNSDGEVTKFKRLDFSFIDELKKVWPL
jgi:hypothetical protein